MRQDVNLHQFYNLVFNLTALKITKLRVRETKITSYCTLSSPFTLLPRSTNESVASLMREWNFFLITKFIFSIRVSLKYDVKLSLPFDKELGRYIVHIIGGTGNVSIGRNGLSMS